jgi:hypothetical protein
MICKKCNYVFQTTFSSQLKLVCAHPLLSPKCYHLCNKTFETKAKIMLHRKKEHKETVKSCSQFQTSSCRFKEESCWFKHELEDTDSHRKNVPENDEEKNHEQVFQKVSENLEPPINQEKVEKKNQN